MTKDPICGMTVNPATALHAEREGKAFYFCSDHCRQKFLSPAAVAEPEEKPNGHAMYTCPMHPEVLQDHPGDCPKCGMALEPKTATAGANDEDNGELRDMTRRFWIAAALAVPVFVLAMAHVIPSSAVQSWANSHVSRWLQFALTLPVVGWAALWSSDNSLQERTGAELTHGPCAITHAQLVCWVLEGVKRLPGGKGFAAESLHGPGFPRLR